MKNMYKKHKLHVALLGGIVLAISVLGIAYFTTLDNQPTSESNDSVEPESITITEDVNNSCYENKLQTTVAGKIVEYQVPASELDEFLRKAKEERKCIYVDGVKQ